MERESGIDVARASTRPRLGLEANGNYLTPTATAPLPGNSFEVSQNWNYRATAFLRQTLADFGRSHHKLRASTAGKDAAVALRRAYRRQLTAIALRDKDLELKDYYRQASRARGTWRATSATAGYSSAARQAGDRAGRRARLGGSSELSGARPSLER